MQLLSRTLTNQALVSPEGRGVLDIVSDYARSWLFLQQYDEHRLGIPEKRHPAKVSLTFEQTREAIATLKARLLERGQASALFGQERGEQLAGILGSIEQSFGGEAPGRDGQFFIAHHLRAGHGGPLERTAHRVCNPLQSG